MDAPVVSGLGLGNSLSCADLESREMAGSLLSLLGRSVIHTWPAWRPVREEELEEIDA